MHRQVEAEIVAIEPFDALESEHIADALAWVASGAGLFRVVKPAVPPKHLVSYFVLVDGEHPQTAVQREMREELGLKTAQAIDPPLMITCTRTVGLTAGHTDVSLWYVLQGDRQRPLSFDAEEFNAARWFPFAEVPLARSDPHMKRFLRKLALSRAQVTS
jgi:8-oxo-dGTP diphosphatase